MPRQSRQHFTNRRQSTGLKAGHSEDQVQGQGQSLIPIDVAIEKGLRLARTVNATEQIPLVEAAGRVLSESIVATFSQPAFDNSAMDGYAVRTDDFTGSGPWTLPVVARIAAGDSGIIGDVYGAARIFTGAPVPATFDAVVMQEKVTVDSGSITVREKPRRGQNLRRAGENFTRGTTLISSGSLLGPTRLALAASQGLGTVGVRRKIVVAIFATGSELREPGMHLEPGQIYNSNRYMLRALLTRALY